MKNVAILGASDDPSRYSYRAFCDLQSYGHKVFPVSPKMKEIEGVEVYPELKDLQCPIDTLTLYVGPALSSKLKDQIVALQPKRVIFNPGSENPEVARALAEAKIEFVEACTLVMLRLGQF